MEEYKKWLESEIEKERIAVQSGADDSKLKACEECLRKVIQLVDGGVDFCNLEIDKRYGIVSKKNGNKGSFIVIARGCDNKGRYIWYTTEMDSVLAIKSYEDEYKSVEYFVELKDNGR